MPTQTSPGGIKYHLIAFDGSGNERTDDPNGKMSEKVLAALRDKSVTDVFLLSHGWQGDVPSALRQYNKWIDAMGACTADRAAIEKARPGFHALIVGLHWPSLAWGDEELPSENVSFAPGKSPVANLVKKYAERLADTPAARAALQTVIESALNDIAPDELPPEVRAAYIILNSEAGLGSGDVDADPSADRETFDPDRVYEAEMEGVSFGWPSLGGLLAPLRTLTFWKMKDRAKSFGETGGFRLLTQIQQTGGEKVRVHLMGHSFGCIVVASALAGPGGAGQLVRPVNTLALMQGALSLWSFCSDIPSKPGRAGFFRSIFTNGKVSGPILTTISAKDTAVGRYYPIAAGARGDVQFAPGTLPKFGAVGTFGARGPGLQIDDIELQPANYPYQFQPGHLYNIESTKYICEGGGTYGAHNDIAKPEVAHAFWCAVM
ncbi:MAG: hypothetical protein ABIZ56_02585 [Chthoniobacteraceae bacterium]